MGRLHGRAPFEGPSDRGEGRKGGQIDAPAAGVLDLRHEAEVEQGELVSVAEAPSAAVAQHRLEVRKPLRDEVAHPPLLGDGAARGVHRVSHDPEVADRSDLHGDGMGERSDPRPAGGVGGQEPPAARLVEMFEDGEGLGEPQPVDFQGGDHPKG